ncbi:hypothetical protein Hdeb2414_s0819g00950351 [Helianthus debilis subsp. tardiflorus]
MCLVISDIFYIHQNEIWISMKQASGMDSGNDVVWEESDGDSKMHTFVCYVSFDSLRRTSWWNQTYNAISFNIASTLTYSNLELQRGFGVRLMDKKCISGLTETSTNSSYHIPNFKILQDSASELKVSVTPHSVPV